MKSTWLDYPVFILSIGKTGTTLLIALLDGHKDLVVIPEETDFFDSVYSPAKYILKSPLLSKEKKVEKIVSRTIEKTHLRLLNGIKRDHAKAKGNIDYSDFDFNLFVDNIRSYLKENELSMNSIMSSVPYAYKEAERLNGDIKCWIEKTPYHVINIRNKIPVIEAAFPNARFIHIFRDPRDNFVAYKKKDPEKWSAYKFVYDFKRWIKITQQNLEKKNHFLLKYEDLVLENEKTTKELTQFLDVEYAESLTQPTKKGVPWFGNSVHNNKFTGISPKSIGKYKQYQEKKDIDKLDALLKKEMQFLGYDDNKESSTAPFAESLNFGLFRIYRKIKDSLVSAKYSVRIFFVSFFR